jgi:hypothetical protein
VRINGIEKDQYEKATGFNKASKRLAKILCDELENYFKSKKMEVDILYDIEYESK